MELGPFTLAKRLVAAVSAALVFACAIAAPTMRAAPAHAQSARPQTQVRALTGDERRPIILVPGLLGSRLCRPNPSNPAEPIVAWGTLGALPGLHKLRLPPEGNDDLRPCGLVREVVFFGLYSQEVYRPIIAHLERLGYRENRDLLIFDYDWRRSVFDNAEALAAFVREKVGSDKRFDILAHSMGGLIARVYAVKLGGGERIARLFSAGTPFLGSVKFYESVENGWGALNVVMGGIAAFRRTMLSFPSIFELSPRYAVCCDGVAAGAISSLPQDIDAWRALGWDGVDPHAMPDLSTAFARIDELQRIVDTPLPTGVEDVLLIGVDQRTPHRVAFDTTRRAATMRIQTTWNGDGTVVRESATIPRAAVHPTSFGEHERILNDPQVQEFLGVALARGVPEAVRTVQIRPRAAMRTLAGVLAELVGVAITPDRPLYLAGEVGAVRVQFRLGGSLPLSNRAVRLELRTPGDADQPIALRADPAPLDPANPFEQSFVGQFSAGPQPGPRILRATVFVEGGPPRIVERPIGVIAQ
jgi:pimeloyl-ACP methyl ester carboxylesterase